ncbi:hypothetical protein [Rhizobium sp.]|uniref:hypothetical protein n=1 Tax=Rhizobium sp. TaxID=391 RepID=UPI0028AA7CA3
MRVGEFRNSGERRIVLVIVYTVVALAFVTLFGVQAYRRFTFPHSVATILDIREEERDGGRSGPYVAIIGLLEFTREANGQIVTCRTEKEIDRGRHRHEIGQKLDVRPATGSCDRVDIIGKL